MTSSYVAYKDSGNTTRAWVGYGDSSTDFNIQNNLGNVTVNGDKVANRRLGNSKTPQLQQEM